MTGLLKFTGWTIVAAIAYAASAGCTQEKSFGRAYFIRGLAWSSLRQPQLAIADYDKYIQLHPDDAYAYGSRGVAKERLGRYKEALADYRICLEMLDDSPGDNRMRAAVEKRMRTIEDSQREGRSE